MTILQDKVVKTRKARKCWGCCQKFEAGTKLRYQTDAADNTISGSYWCRVCDATVKASYDEQVDCGIGFGDVKDYEGWEENEQSMERTY